MGDTPEYNFATEIINGGFDIVSLIKSKLGIWI